MPALFVLGGANGVGKTTWYNIGVENGLISSTLPFVNIDIVQKELGGYTVENTVIAESIVRDRMRALIEEKRDFMIESNLSKKADYEWIGRMRAQGYKTNLFFLSTGDVRINKERVAQRVTEGGHNIPEAIIEQRYRMGLSYLKSEILLFDEAHLVDVAEIAQEMALLQSGKIISKEQNLPNWTKEVMFMAERLQEKRQSS
jgi:predicted ABC-type ATPase